MKWWRGLGFERRTAILYFLLFALISLSPAAGRHNNYVAFDQGTHAILNGANPYPVDWKTAEYPFQPRYLYSPTFGYFFVPFSTYALGVHVGTYFWVMLNFAVFIYGLWSVMSLLDEETGLLKNRWLVIFLLLMFNEMQGSLTNLQSNGLITGLSLTATGLFFRGRWMWAAGLLSVAINFKLYPVALALLLCLSFNLPFIFALAGFTSALFLFPALIMGAGANGAMLHNWLDMLSHEPMHKVYLGLEPTLLRYGAAAPPALFSVFTLLNAGLLALASALIFRTDKKLFVPLMVPAVLCFIILFNKRAESQTFITLAPVYGFMLYAALLAIKSGDQREFKANIFFLVATYALISWIYSDLSPRPFRKFAWEWHFKTFGAVVAYVWAWRGVVASLRKKQFLWRAA
ncbi:MAG: DUF2029 domain-containing protein [Nitrospinae bacterium]|nr:DUF2029 domain-containing protein [Nitrospinota bacterium]